ncbi:hypothetical protein IE53DRAFT_366124 [Violaceomyces palustris]|uniref:Uncharacterized protein n=1 Tax=Violaceomyces palustris TaxID=1673888 RepID=A0ACD0P6J3_9BASI|nr:hypothetical protein IE53DRAFT_366124 [Violaceomyces palustris]
MSSSSSPPLLVPPFSLAENAPKKVVHSARHKRLLDSLPRIQTWSQTPGEPKDGLPARAWYQRSIGQPFLTENAKEVRSISSQPQEPGRTTRRRSEEDETDNIPLASLVTKGKLVSVPSHLLPCAPYSSADLYLNASDASSQSQQSQLEAETGFKFAHSGGIGRLRLPCESTSSSDSISPFSNWLASQHDSQHSFSNRNEGPSSPRTSLLRSKSNDSSNSGGSPCSIELFPNLNPPNFRPQPNLEKVTVGEIKLSYLPFPSLQGIVPDLNAGTSFEQGALTTSGLVSRSNLGTKVIMTNSLRTTSESSYYSPPLSCMAQTGYLASSVTLSRDQAGEAPGSSFPGRFLDHGRLERFDLEKTDLADRHGAAGRVNPTSSLLANEAEDVEDEEMWLSTCSKQSMSTTLDSTRESRIPKFLKPTVKGPSKTPGVTPPLQAAGVGRPTTLEHLSVRAPFLLSPISIAVKTLSRPQRSGSRTMKAFGEGSSATICTEEEKEEEEKTSKRESSTSSSEDDSRRSSSSGGSTSYSSCDPSYPPEALVGFSLTTDFSLKSWVGNITPHFVCSASSYTQQAGVRGARKKLGPEQVDNHDDGDTEAHQASKRLQQQLSTWFQPILKDEFEKFDEEERCGEPEVSIPRGSVGIHEHPSFD